MNILAGYPDRKRNRMKGYDYRSREFYFVTICTKNMWEYFGIVRNNVICLNNLGAVVAQQWMWLERQYSDISLDAWCIMPNHFHGIVGVGVELQDSVGGGRDRSRPVRTEGKSLSGYIGAFKTTSSKIIRRDFSPDFCWHRSFHDRIIRNESELNRIRQYIWDNPSKWHCNRNRP